MSTLFVWGFVVFVVVVVVAVVVSCLLVCLFGFEGGRVVREWTGR